MNHREPALIRPSAKPRRSEPTATGRPALPPAVDPPSFRLLAETMSSLIALIHDETLIYVNPATCQLLGRDVDSLVGQPFQNVVHPDDRTRAVARGRARRAGLPQPRKLVERLLHADGHAIWMDYAVDLVQYDGRLCTLVTGHDVTERLRIEGELRQSEARLAEAQRISHIGSWEWDVSKDQLVWSDELCRIYGADPAEFGGTIEGYLGLVHPDDRALATRVLERAMRRGGPFTFEHLVLHKNGEVRTIFGRGEVFLDGDGHAIRVAGTGQDITERRHIEEELRRSEERFRLAFNHAVIGKAILSPDRWFLQANPAACRILGYTEDELRALPTAAITHPDDLADADELVRRLLDGHEVSSTLEHRVVHHDGRTLRIHLTATLVRDTEGAPLCFVAEFEDVTERRRTEQALRESEERFRNLCNQAPVMLMAFEPDGRVRDVSNFWLQNTGYTRDEVIGHDGFVFITAESQERLRRAIEQNQRSNSTVIRNLPIRGVRKDGTTIDLLATSVAEVGDSGEPKGAICVQINLTDLQRAEAALRESEERYRALVEYAPDAILVIDVEQDRFIDANVPAERLLGYPREKLLTMGPLDFCSERQADGRASCEIVEGQSRKVLEGATTMFEFTNVDAFGREIACQVRLSPLPAAGRKLIRMTMADISELKQLEQKVRHAERLAAVGALAAGVAHEIGNPLMALSMAAHSLERRTCDEYTHSKLVLIREHIDRISRIVRQMNDLARRQSGERGCCDVNRIVRRAVEMLRYDERSKQAVIDYELDEQLPIVHAVEDELTQVCVNLALNAFDAMAANPPSRPRRLHVTSFTADGFARIAFRDTGPGVPAAARAKLFQPFFTTKEAGRGSGLGLSVSYRILEEHGGSLRYDEDWPDGGAFVFELPITAGECNS